MPWSVSTFQLSGKAPGVRPGPRQCRRRKTDSRHAPNILPSPQPPTGATAAAQDAHQPGQGDGDAGGERLARLGDGPACGLHRPARVLHSLDQRPLHLPTGGLSGPTHFLYLSFGSNHQCQRRGWELLDHGCQKSRSELLYQQQPRPRQHSDLCR